MRNKSLSIEKLNITELYPPQHTSLEFEEVLTRLKYDIPKDYRIKDISTSNNSRHLYIRFRPNYNIVISYDELEKLFKTYYYQKGYKELCHMIDYLYLKEIKY